MPLTLPEFVARWKASTLTERAAAQSHFIDLCEVFHQPHPAAADQTGDTYTFEKHVSTLHGGKGFADVWKRGYFGWEYKGKHKDLKAAYLQLADYRDDLENPPLLVVCDQDRFEVHTNFTGTHPEVYRFTLTDLLSQALRRIARFRRWKCSAMSLPSRNSSVRSARPAASPRPPLVSLHASLSALSGAAKTRSV